MNFFPSKFIARHQAKLLFIVVWLHVTILDLFYVTYSGPIFFWKESFQLHTLLIHLTIALLTLASYFLLIKFVQRARKKKLIFTTSQPPLHSSRVSKISKSSNDANPAGKIR